MALVAFDRRHQRLVDTWTNWLEAEAQQRDGLAFVEIPTIARVWAPFRPFIDGGMATSIKVPEILQRTWTIYGDVTKVTRPLGITSRSTITVLLVKCGGEIVWQGSGPYSVPLGEQLLAALRDVS